MSTLKSPRANNNKKCFFESCCKTSMVNFCSSLEPGTIQSTVYSRRHSTLAHDSPEKEPDIEFAMTMRRQGLCKVAFC